MGTRSNCDEHWPVTFAPAARSRRSNRQRLCRCAIRGWERPRFYRYGFLALILIVWEIVGPLINPIFFSYPSKIAVAFYDLTVVTGELPYYLVAEPGGPGLRP